MAWIKKGYQNWETIKNLLNANKVTVDTFNRPNSLTPGQTDTGESWLSLSDATEFRINNNQLYTVTYPSASVIASPRNFKAGFRSTATNDISGLIMKVNNSYTNLLRLIISSGNWMFQRRSSEGTVLLANLGTAAIGDYVEVYVQDDRFDFYVNGEYRGGLNESYNNTYDFIGFYSGSSGAKYFDDFIVEGLP